MYEPARDAGVDLALEVHGVEIRLVDVLPDRRGALVEPFDGVVLEVVVVHALDAVAQPARIRGVVPSTSAEAWMRTQSASVPFRIFACCDRAYECAWFSSTAGFPPPCERASIAPRIGYV
jgi:hypothetical protein